MRPRCTRTRPHLMRPRTRPRPTTMRPRTSRGRKIWPRGRPGLEDLTSLVNPKWIWSQYFTFRVTSDHIQQFRKFLQVSLRRELLGIAKAELLQARCPSCCPTNSVKAQKTTTASAGPPSFRSKFCQIPQCNFPRNSAVLLSPNTLHSAASWRCCINRQTSKYKEFTVICNTNTHYIRPLMMNILSLKTAQWARLSFVKLWQRGESTEP